MPGKTPHDDLFKATFSRTAEVAALMEGYLPAALVKALDLNTLQQEQSSFVGEDLRQYFSDIVYSCQWRQNGQVVYLSLLLEHKRE